jgi:SAM-dependent methyltransferase
METPPVCNYENSDYQSSFWEHGGREYEDAVEAAALRRLLPKSGKRLLELGAGAGRNTRRYTGYQEVVLLDYSRTQLEQAHQRLGDNPAYRYVAADIYHLPFVANLFDGATMIRTLHHMVDPRAALCQVRSVLQGSATFILEFANKKNLKSILRYTLGQQHWNPFSPEPVEFAPLNFDFHPATVRAWLTECGFASDTWLTVSHFRINLFKRVLPLRLLVWMDSRLQPTGSWLQFTPSIFVRSQVMGMAVPAVDGAFFKCPACGAPLDDTPPEIVCPSCKMSFPVADGVYDFRIKPA